jgi:hypothetical protein
MATLQIPEARIMSRRLICLLAGTALLAALLPAQVKTSTYIGGSKFGTVTIIVGPHGPLAPQTTVRGPFFLTVINRSGIKNLHFSLSQNSRPASASAAAAGELVGTDHKDGAQDQSALVELEPGTYYLTAQQELTWTVRLVVNP